MVKLTLLYRPYPGSRIEWNTLVNEQEAERFIVSVDPYDEEHMFRAEEIGHLVLPLGVNNDSRIQCVKKENTYPKNLEPVTLHQEFMKPKSIDSGHAVLN